MSGSNTCTDDRKWEQGQKERADPSPPLQNVNTMPKKRVHNRTWIEVFAGQLESQSEKMITHVRSKKGRREQCKTPHVLLIIQQFPQCLFQTGTKLQTPAPSQPRCPWEQAGPQPELQQGVCAPEGNQWSVWGIKGSPDRKGREKREPTVSKG